MMSVIGGFKFVRGGEGAEGEGGGVGLSSCAEGGVGGGVGLSSCAEEEGVGKGGVRV